MVAYEQRIRLLHEDVDHSAAVKTSCCSLWNSCLTLELFLRLVDAGMFVLVQLNAPSKDIRDEDGLVASSHCSGSPVALPLRPARCLADRLVNGQRRSIIGDIRFCIMQSLDVLIQFMSSMSNHALEVAPTMELELFQSLSMIIDSRRCRLALC